MLQAIAAILLAVSGPDGLGEAEFKALHAKLAPPKGEAWRSIPWTVSLVEAQNRAAREKKPIFIWSMDGNPLGCG